MEENIEQNEIVETKDKEKSKARKKKVKSEEEKTELKIETEIEEVVPSSEGDISIDIFSQQIGLSEEKVEAKQEETEIEEKPAKKAKREEL